MLGIVECSTTNMLGIIECSTTDMLGIIIIECSTTSYFNIVLFWHFPTQMFPVDSPLTDSGLIQLWCLGQVSNEMDRLPKLRLALGIAHQFGCIRALQWCPSGVWEAGREREVNL